MDTSDYSNTIDSPYNSSANERNASTSGVGSLGSNTISNQSTVSQTATIVVNQASEQNGGFAANNEDIVLPLTLRERPRVTWDTKIEDNEGLGRKKSKRCCIFHKEREFGESSTDSSENDSENSDSSSSSGGGLSAKRRSSRRKKEKRRPIARPKQSKVPDFQRYHA